MVAEYLFLPKDELLQARQASLRAERAFQAFQFVPKLYGRASTRFEDRVEGGVA